MDDDTTYTEGHDTGAHAATSTDTGTDPGASSGTSTDTGTGTDSGTDADTVDHPAHSTAAERLGGPSESERESASERGSGSGRDSGAGRTDSASTSAGAGEHGNATLIDQEKAESYRGRWKELKGEFVDEPRRAVRGANELVGEVLDELEQLFRRQRDELERGLDSDDASTEDLRQALGNYRSFFDRLLSF